MDPNLVCYMDRLGDPFLFLEERIVAISPAKIQEFTSGFPKVVFVLEGVARHRFDDGEERVVRSGDAMINFRNARQTYLPSAPPRASRLRALRLTFASGKGDDFRREVLARLPRSGIFPGPANWVAEMTRELRNPRGDSRQRVNALARGALIDLARGLESAGVPEVEPRGHERLCEAIGQYLDKRLAEPLTLDDIARALDRSGEHLARVFRKERGCTIFAELKRLRIERARFLLQCSSLSMREIAAECGFATPAHFSRSFRQYAGVSPSRFMAWLAAEQSSPRWM